MMTQSRIRSGTFDPNAPSGISGWLVLPLLGLIFSFILTCHNIWMGFTTLSFEEWQLLFQLYPWYCLYVAASLTGGFVGLALMIHVARLFFRYDERTPAWFITYLAYVAIIGAVEAVILYHYAQVFDEPSLIENEPKDTIRGFIACLIWIPYFLFSKRVKNTFTRSAG